MVKRLFLFSLIFFSMSAAYAQMWKNISLPEESFYEITYFGMLAGEGSIRIEEIDFFGQEAIKISAQVKSSKFFSFFYNVDDTMVSILDAKTLQPFVHCIDYSEGKNYSRNIEYKFDYQVGQCVSSEGIVPIDKAILEPLGALLLLRTMGLDIGQEIKKHVFDGRDIKEISAIVKKKKKVSTVFGPKNTYVVRPVLKGFRKEGIATVQEKITLYFFDEESCIPFLVTGKLLIGSLKANLIKIQNI